MIKVENPSKAHQSTQAGRPATAGTNAFNKASGWAAAPEDSTTDGDTDKEVWYELKDENGDLYYFNTATGGSQWECPPWFDEVDSGTGAVYYRYLLQTYIGLHLSYRPLFLAAVLTHLSLRKWTEILLLVNHSGRSLRALCQWFELKPTRHRKLSLSSPCCHPRGAQEP